jgi:hypothetical protein
VLSWQLQRDNDFAADHAYVVSLTCAGLNLGTSTCLPTDLGQATATLAAASIMECLLTAEVNILIQGRNYGYPLVTATTTCPARVVATTQGILFPQTDGQRLTLTRSSKEDLNSGDKVGTAQVELQGSGEATIFRFLETDTTLLTPGVTSRVAEEVQRGINSEARPPFVTHTITYGAVGSSVKRVLPLDSHHAFFELPSILYWFWLRLEDVLCADPLTMTLFQLAKTAPGNTAPTVSLRMATFMVILPFKAERINAYIAHTVLLIHLVAGQLAFAVNPEEAQRTHTFSWEDLYRLQSVYSFAFQCYSQLLSSNAQGKLASLTPLVITLPSPHCQIPYTMLAGK